MKHRDKPTITVVRIAWFARYYANDRSWGVFHVSLDDGNYECGAADTLKRPGTGCHDSAGAWVPERWDLSRDEWPADVREAADWFDELTPSQRRRLGIKAEAMSTMEQT